jgi:hypothetical protein
MPNPKLAKLRQDEEGGEEPAAEEEAPVEDAAGEEEAADDGQTTEDVEEEAAEEEEALYKTFAAEQLNTIVESYKALEENIATQFSELETILMGIDISVTGFDPESEEDLAWLSGEMEKILEATPEIAAMENKLGESSAVEADLDTLIDKLSKATDTFQMMPAPMEEEPAADDSAETAEGDAAAAEGDVPAEGDAAAEEAPAEDELPPELAGAAFSKTSDPTHLKVLPSASEFNGLDKKAKAAQEHLRQVIQQHKSHLSKAIKEKIDSEKPALKKHDESLPGELKIVHAGPSIPIEKPEVPSEKKSIIATKDTAKEEHKEVPDIGGANELLK